MPVKPLELAAAEQKKAPEAEASGAVHAGF